MKTVADIKAENFKLKLLNIGDLGSGKTTLALTFPKCFVLNFDPDGLSTIITNPRLKTNLIGWEDFIPENSEDTKRIFDLLNKTILDTKEMFKKGEIETLVLDTVSNLSEIRWIYINQFQKEFSSKSGEEDTRSMYGKLGRWMFEFFLTKIVSFPGNVVVNCHEMLESEEALKRKPSDSMTIVPNILGGFRDNIGRMFSFVFYSSSIKGTDKKLHFYIRTQKGNQRHARSRYLLPEIIEDITYEKIINEIKKAILQEPINNK
jgi:hypothetical protein